MKKKIYFFFPSYINNSGHENSFVSSLVKFSNKINANFFFLIPKKNKKNFSNLNLFFKSSNFFLKILNIFKNYKILKKIFYKHKKEKKILYIDGFSLYDLCTIYLLYRNFDFKLLIFTRHLFKNFFKRTLFNYIISKFTLNIEKIKILTDTSVIRKHFYKKFKIKALLLPIPHTIKGTYSGISKNNKNKLRAWCPGPFRKEKFGYNLDKFIKKNKNNKIDLVISKNYKNNNKLKNISLIRSKSNLSRRNYEKEFNKHDLIILPYDSKNYYEKTSGIFIESISLAKITLVSDKTWMSQELIKFNLRELIVKDWGGFNLKSFFEKIDVIDINLKLRKMKKNYLKFHNQKNFINILSNEIE